MEHMLELKKLLSIHVDHGQIIVIHECLNNGKRKHALRAKEPISVLQILHNDIMESLLAFEKLLAEAGHKT